MAGINSSLWHVSFTLWLFQRASPSFSSLLIWSFKGIIMFMASPVQDPRTKRKRLCHSHCLYPVVFLDRWPLRWTGFVMFSLFISAWSGGFTDTPTLHKGRLRFRLLSFSFCLFSTPYQPANAPALFSLPTRHHSL